MQPSREIWPAHKPTNNYRPTLCSDLQGQGHSKNVGYSEQHHGLPQAPSQVSQGYGNKLLAPNAQTGMLINTGQPPTDSYYHLPLRPIAFDTYAPSSVVSPDSNVQSHGMFQNQGTQMQYMPPQMYIRPPVVQMRMPDNANAHFRPSIGIGNTGSATSIQPHQPRHSTYNFPLPRVQPPINQRRYGFPHVGHQTKLEVTAKDCDQSWVNDWLKRRHLEKPKSHMKDTAFLKERWKKIRNEASQKRQDKWKRGYFKIRRKALQMIHEARVIMCKISNYTEELQKLKDMLIDNVRTTDGEWYRGAIEKSQELKEKLNNLQKKLFNEDQINHLSELLKKRRKKREWQRMQRLKRRATKVETLRKRMNLHQEIDEWQHKAVSEVKASKMIQSLKTEAGQSMVEVNKKHADCKKFKNIVISLKELREIRRKTSLQRGIFILEDQDRAFEKKIEKLLDAIEERNNTYEDERKTLRVMMQEEKEEMKRQDDEKRKKRLEENESNENPLYPHRLYWLQAEDSIVRLVHIRHLWDMYSVPATVLGATRVPDGWVDAPSPSSELWAKFLQKRKQRMKDID